MNYNPINSPHNSLGRVKFTFVLFLWIFVGFVNKAVGQEAYAVYNDKVLTFYYDTQRASRTGTVYYLNTGAYSPGWYSASITTVIFTEDFKNARPTTCYEWFYNCPNLTSIIGLEYLNTSEVTNMSYMFFRCTSLESLDVTKFNTEKVTNMSYMFYGCESLESLDVTKFNTEKVTNMSYMFCGCESLKSLDVTKFNTEKVTTMSYMFGGCESLESLDVTKFNTGNVTNMAYMFYWCTSLKSLDVTKFNTEKVTTMSYMFYLCTSLKSLDVTKFNTEKVTDMSYMFYRCESLGSLDVTKFNTGNVTNMIGMFEGCKSLESLDVTKFNTEKVKNMWYMFDGCTSLKSLDVTKFNTGNVTYMIGMFCGCKSLEYLDVTKFNTINVTDMSLMFNDCKSLESLDVTKFNTGNVTKMNGMFEGCESLESLDVTKFNTGNVTDMHEMFRDCESLKSLDVTKFNTGNVTDMTWMFDGCKSLTTILVDESNWKTDKVALSSCMFQYSPELIGDKGTTYKKHGTQDKSYAHIDGGESNPGYLTTGKYKIFYNGIDDDNATLDTYPNAITEFINEEVTLVEPKKDGYEFTGWTGTKITGLTTTPTKTVTIAKGEVGNRIYTAHWKAKITLSVAINGWIYSSTPSTPTVKKNNAEISLSNVVLKYTDENNQEITPSSTTPVGTYTITATYPESATELSATASTTFTISPLVINLNDPNIASLLSITLNPNTFVYDDTKKEPSVSVKYDGKEIPSSEYTVNYKNNINAGTATAEIVDNNGGNYTVNGSKTFEITPFIIAATDPKLSISLNPTSFTYDGTKKEPSVSVKYDGKEIPSSEYTVNYKNNINVGTATAIITDNQGGNYTVSGSKNFTITPLEIDLNDPNIASLLSIVLNPDSYIYDGKAKEPAVTITFNGLEVPAAEYTVSYQDNINAGTAKAIITDNQGGNYTINGTAPFTINPFVITTTDPNLLIILETDTYKYTGSPIEPKVTVTYNGTTIPSTEYTVSYKDNTNVGTATVEIVDNNGGNYTINGSKTFEITPFIIAATDTKLSITLYPTSFTYDGTKKEPSVSVKYDGKEIPSTEYKVTYENNINVGTATAIITDNQGGNYTVSGSKDFTITPLEIDLNDPNIASLLSIVLNPDSYIYDGKAKEPAVTITFNGLEVPAAEYTVSYQDNINAGTAKTIITDSQGGNYTINGTAPFTINPFVITTTDPNISIIIETTTYEYTGSPIEPKVTVTYNGITIPTAEYTVTYENNINVGTATVVVTDNPGGNYTINANKNFTIKPGKISITPSNTDADGAILADVSNQYFCNGKAVIDFTVHNGTLDNYSIEFDGGEISSQNGAITGNSIEIALPKDLLPGTYNGFMELTSNDGNSTGKLPIRVKVNLPFYTIVTLYNDVAAVNQLAGEFSAYKWTENGSEISGANSRLLQYSFNKSSVYTAILTKTDGNSYETCPLDLSRITEGGTEVNVYPNPGNSLNDVYVEITRNYQPDANNRIFIYNLNGSLIKQINTPQEKNTLQLPSGNYSGVYIQNGEKVPFKLIVK